MDWLVSPSRRARHDHNGDARARARRGIDRHGVRRRRRCRARALAPAALCVYDVVAWWLARRARAGRGRARHRSASRSRRRRARARARRRARVTAAVGSARAAHVAGHPGQADNRVVWPVRAWRPMTWWGRLGLFHSAPLLEWARACRGCGRLMGLGCCCHGRVWLRLTMTYYYFPAAMIFCVPTFCERSRAPAKFSVKRIWPF